ncbi:MAG: hypothetical protein GY832_33150 [Chloroflexi bacterium]|nr:hypothetical protein [Chloroflexota bacterium]
MNVGPLELTVILIIAILTIGPKRMVEIVRSISRVTAQLRRFSNEFTSTLQAEVVASERGTGEPPGNAIRSLTEPLTSLRAELSAVGRETRQALMNVVENEAEPIQSIQAELDVTARETTQVLEQGEIIPIDARNSTTQEN